MIKLIKKNLPFIVILFVTFLVWHKVIVNFPTGEGYYYFAPTNNLNFKSLTIPLVLRTLDLFAQLTFTILIPIFRDNIHFYMYFQFFIITATYLTFYLVINKVFKDKIMALTSTIFFMANYVGQYTMIGQGDYQRFIQRVPNLIPTLISLLFLFYFLKKKNKKYLLYSFCFYLLSVVFSHYTTFFLPLFFFLPIFYYLTTRKIKLTTALVISVIFTAATFLIIHSDPLSRPHYSILKFAATTPNLTKMVLYQISMTGFPIQFTKFIADHQTPASPYPYTNILPEILFIVGIYLYASFWKVRKNKEILSIYLTLIASLVALSFMLMYAYDTIPNPLTNFGEDRLYFVHSIFFAIIWGIIIKTFLEHRKKNTYIFSASFIIFLFLVQNIPFIWSDVQRAYVHSVIAEKFLNTIKTLSPSLNKNSVIVLSSELMTTANVPSRFYNIDNKNLLLLSGDWKSQVRAITTDPRNVYIFDSSYSYDKNGYPDINSVKILSLNYQ